MIHALKQLPEYFEDVISGKKSFEVRKNDTLTKSQKKWGWSCDWM